MTTFLGSSPLTKGWLVGADPANPLASMVVIQFSLDTFTHTVTARAVGGEALDRGEALRLKGRPEKTIKLDVEIDAADQLKKGQPSATTMGIHPIWWWIMPWNAGGLIAI